MTFRDGGAVDQIFVLGADENPQLRDRTRWQTLVDKGLIGHVYYSDRSVVIRNIDNDPRWSALIDSDFLPHSGSATGIPLEHEGIVHAVIVLVHPNIDYFTQEILDFLYEVKDIASHALGNMYIAQKNAESSFDTRYHAIFEHTPVPVILTDNSGVIVDANLKACEFLGFRRVVLQGIPLQDVNIITGEDLQNITEDDQYFPTNTYDIDGNNIPTLIRARRVELDGNHYIEWVLQDMSVQMELEQLRRDLTAMVYHDLRGPMGSISMAITKLQQLLADHENPAVIKILNLGLRSTQQVSRLVEALLDIQRLEGGSSILDTKASQVHEILADAFELVQPTADNAGINVQMDIAYMPKINVDADMIKRVIINLMENAVKYTPTGSHVTLRSEDAGDRIRIVVSDTGPGIPVDMLDSIFKKFSRVSHKNVPKGLGLGLAFCRLAVEAHGGQIWVESDGQSGSDFIFTIPLELDKDDLPETAELISDTPSNSESSDDNTEYATAR